VSRGCGREVSEAGDGEVRAAAAVAGEGGWRRLEGAVGGRAAAAAGGRRRALSGRPAAAQPERGGRSGSGAGTPRTAGKGPPPARDGALSWRGAAPH
jgi:hypothetical protein